GDHHTSDVLTARFFNTLKSWGGVHLQQEWPAPGTDDVHAGHAQAHGLGCPDCQTSLIGSDLDHAGAAPLVQVRAKLSLGRAPFHRGYYFAINDKTAEILSFSFLDEFLHQQVRIEALEGIDHTLRRLTSFGQDNAPTLRTFKELHDQGRAAHHVDQIACLHG